MNTFGEYFRVTTWGESHGKAIGVVIDGCPSGIKLTEEDIQFELDLRRPGKNQFSTPRVEKDRVEILSGVFEGKTTGTPISMIIFNKNAHSKDYEELKDVFRPGHADYTYTIKYGNRDYRGGGRASGRETATRVAAGAVAKKILETHGIATIGFLREAGGISVGKKIQDIVPPTNISVSQAIKLRKRIYDSPVRCPIPEVSQLIQDTILESSKNGDSVGGIIEIHSFGVPPGLGDPVFSKLDALLAFAIMSVGAVKGVEIGEGFNLSRLKGSESNDEFVYREGNIQTKTNNAGGILGGISNGMPIVLRAAVKPTPSIRKVQHTINKNRKELKISIKGRHDPCIAIRAVPVLENMVNLVIVDRLLAANSVKL